MTRTFLAAVLLTAVMTPCLALAAEPQAPAAPSILEPAKPLLDSYTAGLARCYGWPTGAGVFWCRVDLFIEWWHAPTNNGAGK